MKIYPYNAGSKSAKALADALGIKRLKREGEAVNLRHDYLINWGASVIHREVKKAIILNKPECVKVASNKLETFKSLQGHCSIPDWTESPEEALQWLDEGHMVVARTKLNGHSGEGIVLINLNEEFVDTPLYVKYVPKQNEYRIHVFQGRAFFVQRKARNKEIPDEKVNWKIRNHDNGFIFANQDVEVSEEANKEAIMAVTALGLDFGAVDIIYNNTRNKWYVLEVNTACGLSGTTIEKYAEQFRSLE